MHKEFSIQTATVMGLTPGAIHQEPFVNVTTSNNTKFLRLSELSKSEAKKYDINIDEYKENKKISRSDRKALKSIYDSYSKLMAKAPVMFPNGKSVSVKMINGECVPQKIEN